MGEGGNSGSNEQPSSGGRGGGAAVGNDSLANHLASMSKHQLYEIVSQMKDLIHQNQQQARQILIANPQLTKALFQAQIMLGMVRPPAVLPIIELLPLQDVTTQPQPHIQVSQQEVQQNEQQPQIQPPQTQAVQLPHALSVPQKQTMQQEQVRVNQTQQPQMQAVQTLQPPNVQMQPQMQQSQTEGMNAPPQLQASHSSQNLSFQHPVQHPQQSRAQATPLQPSFQSVPSPPSYNLAIQPQVPTMQFTAPQHLQPPLPQQPRPLVPAPQFAHSMSFQPPSIPQQQLVPQPLFQQPAGMLQSISSLHYQQQFQPALLNQSTPQPSFQIPSSGGDIGGGSYMGQGGLSSSLGMLTGGISMGTGMPQVGRGLSTTGSNGAALPTSWNQPLHSSGAMVQIAGVPHTSALVGMSGQMVPGSSFSGGAPMSVGLTGGVAPSQQDANVREFSNTRGTLGGGLSGPSEGLGVSGMIQSQGYQQIVQQLPPQQLQQQPQMQSSPELEQQKALLQQVMNLTPEQINSLPPEQRQQVIQLQQAFQSRNVGSGTSRVF